MRSRQQLGRRVCIAVYCWMRLRFNLAFLAFRSLLQTTLTKRMVLLESST